MLRPSVNLICFITVVVSSSDEKNTTTVAVEDTPFPRKKTKGDTFELMLCSVKTIYGDITVGPFQIH